METSTPQYSPPQAGRTGSRSTVALAAILLSVGSITLLALPTGFIGPVMVFGGVIFFGVIGFHYFVWGRWLDQILRKEMQEAEAQEVDDRESSTQEDY